STGLITGVIGSSAGGSSPYSVTITVSDGVNAAVSEAFTWTITRVQVQDQADQSNNLGDVVSLAKYGWSTSGNAVTWSASGLPPGLSISSTTGLISGTIASNASLTTPYAVTVTATDGSDQGSISFNWNIASFAVVSPGDQSNAEGDAVALQLSANNN